MKCPYCNNGEILRLINFLDFHFNGEEPIEERVSCEECDGTGYIEEDLHDPFRKEKPNGL